MQEEKVAVKTEEKVEVKKEKKEGFLQAFNAGAWSGFQVGVKSVVPNVVLAYALILFLNITNLINVIEVVFHPVMMLLGLPGVAAPALLMGFMSSSSGLAIVASLATEGLLTGKQVAMLLVGIMSEASSLQFIGRVLAITGIKEKHYSYMMVMNVISCILGVLITRLVLSFI